MKEVNRWKEQGYCLWGLSNQGGRMATKLSCFSWIEELTVAWATGASRQTLRIPVLGWSLRPILLTSLFWCFSWTCQPLPFAWGLGDNLMTTFLLFPGAHLRGCPVEVPDLAFCSVTLRVFDKLSWTLCVVECQFVKYPKCGSCLSAPGPGQKNS